MTEPNNDFKGTTRERLAKLEEQNKIQYDLLTKIDTELEKVHDDVLIIKTKSRVWGSIAGAVSGVATAFGMSFLFKKW